jgi:outer membrane protein assembly factor BamB
VRISGALVAVLASLAATSCVRVPYQRADAMSAMPVEPLGESRIAYKWKHAIADRALEIAPQEFASATVSAGTVYIGSTQGILYALNASSGAERWQKKLGAIETSPVVISGILYVGTADGSMFALDSQTGEQKWRYQSRGPVEQPPVPDGDMLVFSNEADQVVALDAISGKLKWQYKGESVEEYKLRGHAGVAVDGDLIYTGFSNGTLAALRKDTGSVAWSTSLKGDAERFVDVDATPLVIGDSVYASSSSGGVYSIDKLTGLVHWRVPFWDFAQPSANGNVGGIATDGKTLYVTIADLGMYAIDLAGNVIWRVGARGGGEPGPPVVWNELLLYSLTNGGLFIAERKTGATLEWFDPGDGVSAAPLVTGDGRLFMMSNRGTLFAFDVD